MLSAVSKMPGPKGLCVWGRYLVGKSVHQDSSVGIRAASRFLVYLVAISVPMNITMALTPPTDIPAQFLGDALACQLAVLVDLSSGT